MSQTLEKEWVCVILLINLFNTVSLNKSTLFSKENEILNLNTGGWLLWVWFEKDNG